MKPNSRPDYDADFYAWTQDQAAALRGLPRATVGNRVDLDHVAEEIEDLGEREVREVESHLRQILAHLLKLAALPDARERLHWIAEIEEFQARAAEAYKPSMSQAIDLSRAWRLARRSAGSVLTEMGAPPPPAPDACPFDLDGLVRAAFDLRAALTRLVANW